MGSVNNPGDVRSVPTATGQACSSPAAYTGAARDLAGSGRVASCRTRGRRGGLTDERSSTAGKDAAEAPARLGVLLSGTGRTLENLLRAIDEGDLRAQIAVVVSSKAGVRGLDIAAAAGIPHLTIARGPFADNAAFSDAVYAAAEAAGTDLLVLAGFLRRLVVPPRWAGRILNIHPALLPESQAAGKGFYGGHVHRAVLESGASCSGATVHVVNDDYDAGPVVAREEVPVFGDDSPETLGTRVFAAECRLYPRAIAAYLADHPALFGPAAEPAPRGKRASEGDACQT